MVTQNLRPSILPEVPVECRPRHGATDCILPFSTPQRRSRCDRRRTVLPYRSCEAGPSSLCPAMPERPAHHGDPLARPAWRNRTLALPVVTTHPNSMPKATLRALAQDPNSPRPNRLAGGRFHLVLDFQGTAKAHAAAGHQVVRHGPPLPRRGRAPWVAHGVIEIGVPPSPGSLPWSSRPS